MLSRGRGAAATGGGSARFAARRCTPSRTPREGGTPRSEFESACATDSLGTRGRATSPFRERDAGVQAYPTDKLGGLLSAVRAQTGGRGPAPPGLEPTPGRPSWPGLGLTGARGRAPHRACAAPRAPSEEPRPRLRPRVERALPPQPPHPARAPSTACREPHSSADGHRFPALTATSAAGSRPLLRLRPAPAASASAHLPAVGQRRHQPTGAGTRQWRPGRRVGAEGAHAAAGAAMSQERVGLRQG